MRAETMFSDYSKMKREAKLLELQLRNFKGLSEEDMITSMVLSGEPEGDRVQTSYISDKTCSVATNFRKRLAQENEDYYRFLYERYAALKKEIDFFENGIRSLGEKKAEILLAMLEGEMTWENIAFQYSICKKTITNYKKSAIKELNILYERREELELEYLLS